MASWSKGKTLFLMNHNVIHTAINLNAYHARDVGSIPTDAIWDTYSKLK